MSRTPNPGGSRTVRRASGSTVGTIVFILIGPIVWALHFTALYAGHAFSCELSADGGLSAMMVVPHVIIATATLLAVTVLSAVLLAPRRTAALLRSNAWGHTQREFLQRAMTWLSALSLIAIAFGAFAAVYIDACVQPT